MTNPVPRLSDLNRTAHRTADALAKSATGTTQPALLKACQAWSEMFVNATRQTRSNMELANQLPLCKTSNDIKHVQTEFFRQSLDSYAETHFAIWSLLYPGVAITDISATRQALASDHQVNSAPPQRADKTKDAAAIKLGEVARLGGHESDSHNAEEATKRSRPAPAVAA